MKLQLSKKLFAFIITIMMFSVLPGIANAQSGCQNVHCRDGYVCLGGHCYRACHHGQCGRFYYCYQGACIPKNFPEYTDPIQTSVVLSLSDSNSADFSLNLTEAQYVSLKIYDVTGRLIKTLADSRLPEGENQIEWNKTDEYGKTVTAGIYILQLEAGPDNSDSRKLTVMN